VVRLHTDAHYDEVGGKRFILAGFEDDAAVVPRANVRDGSGKSENAPPRPMLCLNDCASCFVTGPRHDARRGINNRNPDPEFGRSSGNFEADQPGADHNQTFARGEVGLDRTSIGRGAKVMHAWRSHRQQR
jgi:hypothetical protein